jgi:hypothetical protein
MSIFGKGVFWEMDAEQQNGDFAKLGFLGVGEVGSWADF